MKNILALHDLCCTTKSSLSVVLPVTEALGVECSVIPTAVLSTQTDGFDDILEVDLEDRIPLLYEKMKKWGFSFDAVYSGYLASTDEVDTVLSIMERENTLKFVDPVLGDDGSLYSSFDSRNVEEMKRLVRIADVITPNITEAEILTGGEKKESYTNDEIEELMNRLEAFGPGMIAVTSVPLEIGGLGNVCRENGKTRVFSYDDLGLSLPGCGDLFSSLTLALMMRGGNFFSSCHTAGIICSSAVMWALRHDRERRRGISLIPVMDEIKRRVLL